MNTEIQLRLEYLVEFLNGRSTNHCLHINESLRTRNHFIPILSRIYTSYYSRSQPEFCWNILYIVKNQEDNNYGTHALQRISRKKWKS